eukprot:scaffold421188_cov47-Attheya_sp.AAC.5
MAQETTELLPPAMAGDRSGRRIDADEQAHHACDSNKRPREEADEKEYRRSRGYSRGVIHY